MGHIVFEEYQGKTVRIEGTCYTYTERTYDPVDTDPLSIEGTFSTCLECELVSSSSDSFMPSSISESSESIGGESSSSESLENISSSSSLICVTTAIGNISQSHGTMWFSPPPFLGVIPEGTVCIDGVDQGTYVNKGAEDVITLDNLSASSKYEKGQTIEVCEHACLPNSSSSSFNDGCFEYKQAIEGPINGDRYGTQIKISGKKMFVGASHYDSLDSYGKVFYYELENGSWTQKQMIEADSSLYRHFGWQVAYDGGNYCAITTEREEGYLFIYRWNGSSWVQHQIIQDPNIDDYFGVSCYMSGDRIIIGAYQGTYETNGGLAYIYARSGSTWYLEKRLSSPNAESNGYFGNAVSIYGDHAIVGARREYGERGRAYAYERINGKWKHIQTFTGPTPNDGLGYLVRINGDRMTISQNNPRYVYAYEWNGDSWDYVQGFSLGSTSFQTSIDGDQLLIGQNLYRWIDDSWIFYQNFTEPNPSNQTYNEVAVNGDYIGIGSYIYNDGNPGKAYMYECTGAREGSSSSTSSSSSSSLDSSSSDSSLGITSSSSSSGLPQCNCPGDTGPTIFVTLSWSGETPTERSFLGCQFANGKPQEVCPDNYNCNPGPPGGEYWRQTEGDDRINMNAFVSIYYTGYTSTWMYLNVRYDNNGHGGDWNRYVGYYSGTWQNPINLSNDNINPATWTLGSEIANGQFGYILTTDGVTIKWERGNGDWGC